MYHFMVELQRTESYSFTWIEKVKNLLTSLDLAHLWTEGENMSMSENQFKSLIKQRLWKRTNDWFSDEVRRNNKCLFYRHEKEKISFEPYLKLLNISQVISIARFRGRSNSLPITKHFREGGEIANAPICMNCDLDLVCDEMHLLFQCTEFDEQRRKLLPNFCRTRGRALLSANQLFACKKTSVLKKLAEFVKTIMSRYS